MKVSPKVNTEGVYPSASSLLSGISHLVQLRRMLKKNFGPNYTEVLKFSSAEKKLLGSENLSLEERVTPSLIQLLQHRITSIQALHLHGIQEGVIVKELGLHHGTLRGVFTGVSNREEKLRLQITVLEDDQFLSANPEFASYCDSQEAHVVKAFGGRPRFVIMYPLPNSLIWDVIPFQIPLGALPLHDAASCLIRLALIDHEGNAIHETLESIAIEETPTPVSLSFSPQAIGLWPIDPKTGSWMKCKFAEPFENPVLVMQVEARGQLHTELAVTVAPFSDSNIAEPLYVQSITPSEDLSYFAFEFSIPWEEGFEFVEVSLKSSSGEILCGEVVRAPVR